jgi:hypothetical protein
MFCPDGQGVRESIIHDEHELRIIEGNGVGYGNL